MKEPCFKCEDTGAQFPYSHAPKHLLELVAGCDPGVFENPNPDHPECYDTDFRRRYAAILLRERGL